MFAQEHEGLFPVVVEEVGDERNEGPVQEIIEQKRVRTRELSTKKGLFDPGKDDVLEGEQVEEVKRIGIFTGPVEEIV